MESLYKGEGIVLPEKLEIPTISDERLLMLYKFLKPIVTIDEMKYLLKEYTLTYLKNTSYIWEAEYDITDKIEDSQLEPIEEFLCLHTYGYYGLFKPTISEILVQVPNKTLCEADFFEMVEIPETRDDVFRYKKALDEGYHLSRVRSYKLNK